MLPPGDPRAALFEEVRAAAEGQPTELYTAAGFLPGGPRKLWVALTLKDGWSRRYESGPEAGPGIYVGRITPADMVLVARKLLEAGFPNIGLPALPAGAPGFPAVSLYVKGKTPGVDVTIELPVPALREAPGLLASLDAIFEAARKSAGDSKWLASFVELARSPNGVPTKSMPERVIDAVHGVAEGGDVNGFTVVVDLPTAGPMISTEVVQLGGVLEGQNGAPRTKLGSSDRAHVMAIAKHLRDVDLLHVNVPPGAPGPSLKLSISCDKDLRFERSFPVSALDVLPALRAAVFAVGGASEKLLDSARRKQPEASR